jgi:hypothetical protein
MMQNKFEIAPTFMSGISIQRIIEALAKIKPALWLKPIMFGLSLYPELKLGTIKLIHIPN